MVSYFLLGSVQFFYLECDNGVTDVIHITIRYPHVEKDHLVKLLKQMLLNTDSMLGKAGGNTLNAAHVPTILGSGSFSLLDCM